MKVVNRKRFAGLAVVLAGAGVVVAAAIPAAASQRNGYLESYELGLYYNSGQGGCVFDLEFDNENFAGFYFTGPSGCAGRGEKTNDNTASYYNNDVLAWKVATDKDYDGNVGTIPKGYRGNATVNFKNKISSAYPLLGSL
ncbi:hypothetical protein OG625_08365 [Streptomyces sp. NBC_01351]|uniref:hypothetical protein n=1 Tax=Streptomyces sp. NBC_01351 TaxID=2903833 RepID=UPI002E37DBD7|nr:hypothetical protein [Streptomyces sp. NBC_01351]